MEDKHKIKRNIKLMRESISVMSYNILAQSYVKSDKIQSWDIRKELLLSEILDRSADIICLQEVESDVFLWFKLKLSEYDGTYEQKTPLPDGCAIFYNKSKFTVVSTSMRISFSDMSKDYIGSQIIDKHNNYESLFWKQLRSLHDVGVCIILEYIETKKQILVGNCHIHYNHDIPHVKVMQTLFMLHFMKHITETYKNASIILCGDFNSTPTNNINILGIDVTKDPDEVIDNGVYHLIKYGSLPEDHKHHPYWTLYACIPLSDFISEYDKKETRLKQFRDTMSKIIINNEPSKKRKIQAVFDEERKEEMNMPLWNWKLGKEYELKNHMHPIKHSLSLQSAYYKVLGHEPELTHFRVKNDNEGHQERIKDGIYNTLDYIWYSPQLFPITVLETPTRKELEQTGLPNHKYPSDHIALYATFCFI
jgi:mRNA deadenylase 3'-5' endonuclease subunit Ccr4